ncbi:helix-turn-helix domain-containing protein [Halobacteria archaeon AArc-dxtr1]|nr:helix-turn-helix domain-containing protein [Halobacteria archaeon AArc-dxtr1]
MSVIATVWVPDETFSLGSSLTETGASLAVEPTVSTGGSAVPYLWAQTADPDRLVADLEADATVASATVVDRGDGYVLVKFAWAEPVNGFLGAIRRSDALVMNAVRGGDGWQFQLRFPSYDAISAFYAECREHELSIDVRQLSETVAPGEGERFGLTEPQRELVVAAYEAGYFDVPRQTTLVELGEQSGISDVAASQRLRRGLQSLVGSTVALGAADADEES